MSNNLDSEQETHITKNGKTIFLKMNDPAILEHIVGYKNFYEHWMLEFIEQNFQGGTFIDAGSNFGNHALFFAEYCNAEVVAIEPVPYNYSLLCRNIRQNNSNVIPVFAALGEQKGFCNFKIAEGDRWSQARMILGEEKELSLGRKTDGANDFCSIPVMTIDSLSQFYRTPVELIKIDCEGMEKQIIFGAKQTLEAFKPELFIEIWEQKEFDEIDELLSRIGYRLIERYNVAPTYHFSTLPLKRTYTPPAK